MPRPHRNPARGARQPRQARSAPLPPNRTPLIIAHRGASEDVAEHTLPAYLSAIEAGADGLECDVRLTRDGHLVCVHDRTVDRTSNGRGVVSELELARLRELDFQSWHDELPGAAGELLADGPEFAGSSSDGSYLAGVAADRLDPESSKVLTLETLLAVVKDASRPIKLLIETKHPTRYGGLVEKELVHLLERFNWAGKRTDGGPADSGFDNGVGSRDPVTIMSFAPIALRRIRLLAPGVPLVLLMDRSMSMRRDGSLPTGVRTAGPSIRLIRANPDYVHRAHQEGNRIFCWTVDEPADARLVADLGVDAIITNRPRRIRASLTDR